VNKENETTSLHLKNGNWLFLNAIVMREGILIGRVYLSFNQNIELIY